ncbi:MAG TPA: FmdB family transcriptional regulator [Acidimicrobiaceae bacterium]|nr:FmdB family transcriptional regulator [Acidimicrobiaceae bacterium]
MPTYEYACTKCGEHLEVVQSFRDDALDQCPNCGGKLRKVFGSIGVVFKGSGFYKTDSRPAAKTSSGDSAASKTSGDSSAASASDTGSKAKEKSAPSTDSGSGAKSDSAGKSGGSAAGSAAAAS